METILEMKDISKHFSGVKALDKIQFNLRKGEIHSSWRKWSRKINYDQNPGRNL